MTLASDDKVLILFRHAKAEQVLGKPDHERELTARGVRDARAAGKWLHEHELGAELVLCSTARRARETLERIEPALGTASVRVEQQNARNDAIAESIETSAAEARFDEKRRAVLRQEALQAGGAGPVDPGVDDDPHRGPGPA